MSEHCDAFAQSVLGGTERVPCPAPAIAVVAYKCANEHVKENVTWCKQHLDAGMAGTVACARCAALGVVNAPGIYRLEYLSAAVVPDLKKTESGLFLP